jgi:putative resolvase
MSNPKHKFVRTKDAASRLGVCKATVQKWARNGRINFTVTPGGQRRYDLEEYVGREDQPKLKHLPTKLEHREQKEKKQKSNGAIYARVSSRKQTDDLQRQVETLQEKYPEYAVFKDVCSGLNYKRPGLQRLLGQVQGGVITEVVVAHKDRLARFGVDLIKWFLNQAGASLVIEHDEHLSSEQELSEDLMAIVHVFSCRANGKRRYKTNQKRKDRTLETVQEQIENRDRNNTNQVKRRKTDKTVNQVQTEPINSNTSSDVCIA